MSVVVSFAYNPNVKQLRRHPDFVSKLTAQHPTLNVYYPLLLVDGLTKCRMTHKEQRTIGAHLLKGILVVTG